MYANVDRRDLGGGPEVTKIMRDEGRTCLRARRSPSAASGHDAIVLFRLGLGWRLRWFWCIC